MIPHAYVPGTGAEEVRYTHIHPRRGGGILTRPRELGGKKYIHHDDGRKVWKDISPRSFEGREVAERFTEIGI